MFEQFLYRAALIVGAVAVLGVGSLLIARYVLMPLVPYVLLFGILIYAVRYMFRSPRK